ncbi:hypothetical protein [Massilicoli timonensis]|nr:hypothetical protein [Massilicoli timonensis]
MSLIKVLDSSFLVLLRNHFKQEGTLKNAVCKNGVFYDLLLFGKLK